MRTIRPSLNALRAFEAVARLRSMSAAAGELAVTHGAISRHVKSLEDTFGLPLLQRDPRSVHATPEGARLAAELSGAFALIESAVAQLRPGPLTLSCSATIMMYWLIPRLGDFHSRHPEIELRFNMNYDRIDFIRDEISVAIRNSMIEPPKDVVIQDAIAEWIGPVCSPEYLEGAGLRSPADLSRCRLLAPKTRMGAWTEWTGACQENLSLSPQQAYEHYYLLIQAACCGLGVAIVPKLLVLDDLRSGKLVAPFGFVLGPHKLVLWIAPHLRTRPDTGALTAWLVAELRQWGTQEAAAEVPDRARPECRPGRVKFPHR